MNNIIDEEKADIEYKLYSGDRIVVIWGQESVVIVFEDDALYINGNMPPHQLKFIAGILYRIAKDIKEKYGGD